ncbi:neuroblast differentiation-associated protein AHNAK-like isoform X1 [Xiphophorus maculatus]|uniref:neuroblast differentiation-associated protein AHNAK-like isoform X1 n=1 Tax=Xiphophorus maculatus TaxID=8083 RepID=UPI000C6EA753|nr:neuroblast differentiation-associated protein AHNAK-like isoform X1 [Xiphophorus maculatus]
MCDCFHLAFPNWHVAPSGTAGRRLRAPEPATQDNSICEEPTQFAEGERPRPQGSSPVQEYPEAAKYADKECEEHDADHKAGSGHKGKKSGLGFIFERTSTPKMSKLKEAPSPEGGVIVNTAQDGCAEGLVYGGGGKEGIFIKKVVPESPASKSLKVKEGDQILSATVYFDNMSYEDAIQILEHAQAYKLKLCLKRQPDFTETEPTIDSDVIPEEEVGSTEMREQGKTRRRGDARISWPKFPSFGKGRKSRFTRSHSSSEADEQRKLELSPTTSDTESPIKSQDALKGKKKHKIKLSGLKRRGRISSSEDQDTDAPTSGQMSSDVQQKQESDTLSPEFPEYPIAETPEINEQAGEAMESDPVQHKVELVSVDATLKTTDQTVALGDEEGQSGAPKSPDEKKKKKERSELKMKILGKDKSHKKDAKAKSSPKRLKTLGASVDTEDLPEAGKSAAISSSESKTRLMGDQSTVGVDNKSQGEESSKLISSKFITSQIILPKVELDISLRKSPKKGDDKTQKGKETKQKQSKKSSPKHKQLELDMSNVANAEEMQTVNDQEPTTTTGRVSTTQLPKREDIEIPGMEDMSVKTTVADYKKRNKESQAETVQMSIDVDSVKEAVSKLPGFKLPQLDISGVPIPEEITVIDANAQRISVKTPTKVAKPKQEEHLTRSDTTASSEISKTIFLTDNKFDFKKSQMEDDTSPPKCKSEEEAKEKEFDTTNGKAATEEELKTSTRPKITMPSFGMSAKSRRLPYIGIDMQKPSFIQEKELTTETRKDERQTGEVICKVKIPELDGIEYIDSADESVKKDGVLTNFNASTDTKTILAISLESKETSDKPEDERNKLSKVRISPSGKPSGKVDISDKGTTKPLDRDGKSTFKWPNLDISVPKIKGTTVDINTSKKDAAHTVALAEGGQIPGGPESDTVLKSLDVPKEMAEAENPQVEIKPTETEGEFDWEASKCTKFGIKTPKIKGPEFDLSLSKKEAHGKAAGKLPEASKAEVSPGKGNVYFLKQKMQLEKPGEVKPLQSKGEHVQGGKIKIPKFGVKTTKLAGPEISLSKKDAEVTLPEAKHEIKLTEGTGTDVNKDSVRSEEQKGMEKSDLKIKTLQKEGEAKGHGHKIKMPQLGIALPKVTTHESDLSLSKKGKDLTLPEVKGEIKDLEIEGTGSSTKLDVRAPGIKVETKDVEGSLSKFKMSPFKISRFGAATPNLSGEVSEASETHTLEYGPGTDVTIPDSDVKIIASEIDGRASKFKIPKFGISLPKLKGSETDTTQSQKVNVDVTLFKGDTEIKLTDAEHEEPGIRLKGKFPQIGVQQDVEYSAPKPEIPVPFSDAKAEVKLSQVDGEKIHFSSPVVLNETPELEIPTTKAEHHLAGQEEKMKLSKIGIKMPKIKGPEFQLGLSSKDTDVMETEGKVDNKTKVEVPVPTDVSLGKAEILISSGKVEVGKPEVQTQPTVEGQGGKFKMPKFGITVPKVKGPEAKKEVEVKLTETKTDIKIPDANFEAPDVEQSPSKFNMPTFKLPKLGLGTSDKNVEGDDIDKDIPDEVLAVTIVAPSSDLSNIDVDTHLFESKTEVALSSDDVNKYSIEVEATPTQIKVPKKEKEGSPSKFKMPTFKLPKFGLSVQSSTEKEPPLDKDLKTGEGQITTSGEILSTSLEAPRIDVKAPSVALKTTGTESEERERKFKLPSLGFSASQTKGPDTDITLPTTEVDVTAPEVKAEIQLPEEKFNKSFEVEAKAPEFKGTRKETEGSPSKFKMPTFKMPKFGLSGQSSTAEVPPLDKDLKTGEGEITTSGEILIGSLEVPRIDVKAPSVALETTGTESEGSGRKFKLPSLGFSASQTKGPDTDIILRTTDVDITLPTTEVDVTAPEVKAEIQLPEEKFNKSFEVEAKAPEFKGTRKETEGSPSKFKMPTFKMPRFGLSGQSSTAELPSLDKDLKTGEGEITTSGEILVGSLEAPRIDVKAPSVALETTGTESEGRGRKFKLPSLGFSASQTKGPDTDIILRTTDVDITLPTTDVDVTAPEVKAEIQLPEEKFNKSFEVEAKAPEFKGTRKETEGSPSKFKMPTFKMPRFGLSGQSSTAELPSLDKDLKTGEGEITTSGEILVGSLEAPRIDVKAPSVALETTGTESEGRGRKFKLPSLGFSASQTKGPDTDIILRTTDVDITLPTTDVDVTAPEVKAEIQLPEEKFNKSFEVEAKAPEFKGTRKETEGSPSKFKMPTFKMPRFGLSGQSSTAELPSLDKDLKTGEGEITTSGEILVGSLEAPRIDVKAPSVALKTTGTESEGGRGRKFKLPSLGFSASQTKGPDTDIILRTTDVDVTAPEVKTEIQLPEEKFNKSFEVEAKAPEFKGTRKETEGSPSKFKMPTFKMPRFGLSGQSSTAELPSLDKDLKTGEGEITTSGEILVGSLEAPRIDIKAPSVALETTGTESEGRGRKFKLPSLGFSASQTKGPDTDISLPTTDVDISLPATDVHVTAPEIKAEIQIPEEKFNKSFEVEAKAPEFKGTRKETEGSPSKFKMPTFKMPRFGLSGQSSTAEVPPLDKDLKIPGGEMTMSEEVIVVSTEEPSVEIGDLCLESKKEGSEREGKGKRFKMPSLGFSATQAKVPDTDFSLKTGVDVTQPEIKAEVKFPDNELKRIDTEIETKAPEFQVEAKDIEGSTSKFKMPTFKLPKFGLATQSSTEEVPSFDKDVKIGGGETTGLEEVLTVTTEGPSVEIKGTSVDLRTEGSDLEGKGRKFKLPSLSFSVPQAKEPETDLSLRTDVDVKVPEVKAEIKLPSNKSVEVETKALETKDTKKSTEGSPSKFKMPNFKLPKFGLATQTSTGEVPPLDEDVKPIKGKIPTSEEVIVVTTEAPTIEIKGPLLELKTEGIDREEKGKNFKLPSLGFSASEAKGTGSDLGLSKTELDVTLPEVKAEVKLPDDENLIKTSTAIEIKGPEIKTVTKDTDSSPSKFKMPAFKLPKFGLTTQSSTEEGSPLEKDEEDGEPKNTVTAIETKTPEITVVSKDTDGSPSKFKMPTFKLPKFGLATQSSNKQVQDVKTVRGESTTLEEVLTVTTEEPSIKIKGPSVDLRSSEIDDERKGSKFKLPSLGFSLSQSKGPDTNISLPKADVDVTAPEVKAEVQFSSAKVEQPSVQMDVKSPEIKADINTTSEVKMPKITLPKFGAVTPHVSMEIPKMTKEKRGDVDLHVDTDPVDLNVKEGELKKYEVQSPSAEAKGEDVPTVELEGKVKRLNWTFPNISFSRTGGKAPDVDVNMETPKAGVTSMETKISDVDIKESSAVEATPAPELDPGLKKSKFSLPKFSFSKPSLKEHEVKAELPDHGIEVENYETDMTTEIKLSADEDKNVLTAFEMTTSEAEVKSKKFKMPTLKMPRFGSVSYEVTTETHISDKTAEDDGSQLGEGAAVIIRGPKTDFKSDACKSEQQDQETLNTESDSVVQGSPSKFKLPTFKMPRMGLSRSKLEDESVHFEYENSEDQLEVKTAPKEEDLSQKLTLTSFGDILKLIDVDFDVRKVDKVDQDVETSKQSHEPGEATTKHTSAKTKHDTTKSPESSSWFKFPKFGLSSPTEQQKIPDKAEQVKDSSPVGETKDEEVSPTLSVQSSDAFADVSSTITSEPVDPFIPSPTKVTVKYSDESAGPEFEEMHSDIMTSTTRTELITDVPTLPEKVTILSSGVSSSSEDTVRLTSGKIHIITSNVQPTPESQHAKILSAVQVQSGEGFALQSEGDDAPLWTVQDARSATRKVKHLVQETTTERSENKETVVITKQITHIFGPTEPISGETASSIQRLKDSVHTEKMRFFDEAEK